MEVFEPRMNISEIRGLGDVVNVLFSDDFYSCMWGKGSRDGSVSFDKTTMITKIEQPFN